MGESEMCSFSVIGSLAPESHETYFSVTQHRKYTDDCYWLLLKATQTQA